MARSGATCMLRPMCSRIWVTIPTFNEVGNVERIVPAVLEQLERVAPGDHRLLIVDDNSPDGTGKVADRLAQQLPAVEVLHRRGKKGLGEAYLASFERALAGGAELVIVMDADFSHDPAHLPSLIAAAAESDLVLGSRYITGGQIADWPRLRRLLSRGGSLYARSLLGVHVRDLTTGFRCIRREVLEAVGPSTLRSQGYVFNIELTYRTLLAGFRVEEVPIVFRDRTLGRSKISLSIAVEALLLVPSLRFPVLARARPATQAALAGAAEPNAGDAPNLSQRPATEVGTNTADDVAEASVSHLGEAAYMRGPQT
jgi:dolichol-phosphate mannosyltransferase